MSERTHYPAGVPCWVTGLQSDPRAGLAFYGPLFGWEFEAGPAAADGGDPYFLARLRGSEVAGIAPLPPGQDVPPAWITEVRVDDVGATARRASEAGGTVLSGPMDLGVGRLVVIADPAGAVLCGWEARGREGAQRVNEPGAWAMSLLHTPDPDGAATFYRDVFGWEAEAFGPVALFRLPGYVGGESSQPVPRDVVAAMTPLQEGAPRWDVDFWIDDADAGAARAADSGATLLREPHDAPPFRRAIVRDPQGAAFSISQLVTPPAG